MESIIKNFNILLSGLSQAWRGAIITLATILTFLYLIGFNIETIKDLRKVEKSKKIELLTKKHKQHPEVIERSIKDLFRQTPKAIGIAVYAFEPIIGPTITKVIFRVGDDDFITMEYNGKESPVSIDPEMFMANREGLPYFRDLDISCHESVCLGIKSSLSYPISYRNIVVGNITVFFNKEHKDYSESEIRAFKSRSRDKSVIITEGLYYHVD